ncbi:type II secretion system protein [Geotoga petraea]|jgi:prepilin-type N-terminal cleavage/methylation domain-containing protein|uniref:N-terminal methylation site-containing protein n=1 Tax=Geotoga petraea TaxID=28234 RepID=A0A1G6PBU8_9BACT|nr:prepilin-type N-terminal cleavage/methylation domain-containing protein [Geotoga petraea]MDK2946417.1 type pilus assembly protein PilA [Geotoga sp.]TGG87968.1 prepilin-type N-terminal cleavage/methylation domain-containing protein [Geotoga petraea]SDC77488.1 N-terminal methylation site-containing protein [Geotoga petraea]
MNKKWKEGFSLIEVIIVLGVIAVIASIAIPSVSGLIDQAKATKVVTNMRTLQTSIVQYSIYNDDLTDLSFQKLIDAGLLTAEIPDLDIAVSFNRITISYTQDSPDISKLKEIDTQILGDETTNPYIEFKVR